MCVCTDVIQLILFPVITNNHCVVYRAFFLTYPKRRHRVRILSYRSFRVNSDSFRTKFAIRLAARRLRRRFLLSSCSRYYSYLLAKIFVALQCEPLRFPSTTEHRPLTLYAQIRVVRN